MNFLCIFRTPNLWSVSVLQPLYRHIIIFKSPQGLLAIDYWGVLSFLPFTASSLLIILGLPVLQHLFFRIPNIGSGDLILILNEYLSQGYNLAKPVSVALLTLKWGPILTREKTFFWAQKRMIYELLIYLIHEFLYPFRFKSIKFRNLKLRKWRGVLKVALHLKKHGRLLRASIPIQYTIDTSEKET